MSGPDNFHPGELLMVGIRGKTLDADQARFLRRNRIRAVVLFRDNIGDEQETGALVRDLIGVLGARALIALDQEGGAVVRVTFLPQPPAAMALGAAGDETIARDVGAAVARGLRSLGFNWNFAPVLDVNNNPENPVIGERSFSADPREVARLGSAWMRRALSQGVACCIKHFPGHGDTSVDSHLDLPVVDKPRERLDRLELLPSRALLHDAAAIMTAHIVYSCLDAERPATLSRAVLTGLLRRELDYDGVIITDSLVMKAIHDRYGHDRAAVIALSAGADMLMALGSQDEQAAAIAAISAAIASRDLELDARPTILASNIRARYGSAAWRRLPDLHLILWNPFQALDLPAPSVITWGYGEGALVALRAWLEGRAEAPGRTPVPLRPAAR